MILSPHITVGTSQNSIFTHLQISHTTILLHNMLIPQQIKWIVDLIVRAKVKDISKKIYE
jgi:hypothetical protein